MKKTYKIVPFDIELAKKIQAGEIKGKIKDRGGHDVRILCWERKVDPQIVYLSSEDSIVSVNNNGRFDVSYDSSKDLFLEVPDNEPQFKPFDKVLVRSSDDEKWMCAFFSHITENPRNLYASTSGYTLQCIPYDGNEHLVGTTDKPKEE